MKTIIFTFVMMANFAAQANSLPWICDSGFKINFGGGTISNLQLNSKRKYDLSIASSSSDVGPQRIIAPILIASDLDCKFSTDYNGAIVKCTNGVMAGAWFSLNSSYKQSTSMEDDGSLTTRPYVEVIVSSGDPAITKKIKQVSGADVLRYIVNLDLKGPAGTAMTRCGF